MGKIRDDSRETIEFHEVGIDVVVLQLHIFALHINDLLCDRHELAVRALQVLQLSQKDKRFGAPSSHFYSLLNNIIGKTVFISPFPSALLTLNLTSNGGEFTLTLLTALG